LSSATLVKVCGIANVADAFAAVEAGADMLGFVFAESPRRVDVNTVKHIQQAVGPDVITVGVFTDESDDILLTMEHCGLAYAQLHGGQSEAFARRIGCSQVIRVARVNDEDSIKKLAEYQEASFYLLDTYKKGVPGGTGETFDWDLALQAKSLAKPIILSGGLNPENAGEAVRTVRPYAVDVSSGVEESPGRKDHVKIQEFIQHVREADTAS